MQAPKRLSKEGKGKWAELAGYVDLSNPFAAETLSQYCEQWCIYTTAMAEVTAHVAQTGTTSLTQTNGMVGEHPSIDTSKNASVQMRLLKDTLTIREKAKASWD